VVPASRMFFACSDDSSPLASLLRALARDSPVTVAVFTRSPNASITRQSAATKSPSSTRVTSPGTSSSAGISTISPPRSALTICGRSWRSAATARSALYSCQKEKQPLTTMTPTIAMPRWAMPRRGCSARQGKPATPPATGSGRRSGRTRGRTGGEGARGAAPRDGSARIPPAGVTPRPRRDPRRRSSGSKAPRRARGCGCAFRLRSSGRGRRPAHCNRRRTRGLRAVRLEYGRWPDDASGTFIG